MCPRNSHAPDVGRLAAALIGQPEGQIRFAKGAVAAIRFDGPAIAGNGELQWLVTAKVLGC
jgi:phosphohistidine phosphatase SixA